MEAGISNRLADERGAAERRRNRVLFREVNARVAASCEDDVFQLLCECGDPACVDSVDMQLRQFQRIRRHEGRFVVRRGHESRGGARLLERHSVWSVEYAPD